MFLFTNDFKVIHKVPIHHFSIEDFKQEQSFYAASPKFVKTYGGKIAQFLLDHIPEEYLKLSSAPLNIDFRVHDLQKGEYPASPGWHCDESLREHFFGQTQEEKTPVFHSLIVMLSSHKKGVSNTEFIKKPSHICLDNIQNLQGQEIWNYVDKEINKRNDIKTLKIKDGEYTLFSPNNLHRVSEAHNDGIRCFMRISFWNYHNKNDDMYGTLSSFEQIYKKFNY